MTLVQLFYSFFELTGGILSPVEGGVHTVHRGVCIPCIPPTIIYTEKFSEIFSEGFAPNKKKKKKKKKKKILA